MSMQTQAEVISEPGSCDQQVSLYGLMAQFEQPKELLEAAERVYARGFRRMDAFSPFPMEGLAEALGKEGTPVPLFTLLGGMAGGLGGYFMQWYSMRHLYALNVGGRPLHSWPNFIPVTFELTILVASLSALAAMLFFNRLPQPNHPVFNVESFRRASIDRFFLCIEEKDPLFDLHSTRAFLESLHPVEIVEVLSE